MNEWPWWYDVIWWHDHHDGACLHIYIYILHILMNMMKWWQYDTVNINYSIWLCYDMTCFGGRSEELSQSIRAVERFTVCFFSAFPSRCFGMLGSISAPRNIVSSDNWDKNAKIPISSTPSLWEETWTRKPWRCLGRSWHRVSWSWWWCNWAAVPKPRFS